MRLCNGGRREVPAEVDIQGSTYVLMMLSSSWSDLKKWPRAKNFFWDFGLDLRFRISLSWTINNLEEYSKANMLRIIFASHIAPGAYSKYAHGAVCIQIMLLEHICTLNILPDYWWSRTIWSRWSWTISQGQNLKKASHEAKTLFMWL